MFVAQETFKSLFQKIGTPSLVFWLLSIFFLGIVLGLETLFATITSLTRGEIKPLHVALFIPFALSLVLPSTLAQQAFTFLQGEWSWQGIFRWATTRRQGWIEKQRAMWDKATRAKGELSEPLNSDPEITRHLASLTQVLLHVPTSNHRVMPTFLGNVIQSTEEYVQVRYGMSIYITWPRLYHVLPQDSKQTLSQIGSQIHLWLENWVAGLLFVYWTPIVAYAAFELNKNPYVALLAPIISIVWIWFAYLVILERTIIYVNYLKSAFDLYRKNLYTALMWPLPKDPNEEQTLGRKLTAFLQTGVKQNIFYKTGAAEDS